MNVRQQHDLSTPDLIRELAADVRTLIRQEIALARAELRDEMARIAVTAALGAAAAGALGLAGLWILVAITRALAVVFSWPLTLVYAGLGAALGAVGVVLLAVVWHRVRTVKLLPRTRSTLAGDARLLADDPRHSGHVRAT